MQPKIFKLHFSAPVHFGKKRISDAASTFHADTLFSALFIEALNLKMDTSWLLEDLVISDGFPFIDDQLYLPKPLAKVDVEIPDPKYAKTIKKMKYLPMSIYQQFLDGKLLITDIEKINQNFDLGTEYTATKANLIEVFSKKEDAKPYVVGAYRFNPNAGLYFMAKGSDESILNLQKVLESLQYSGIGGKRSAGFGRFSVELVDNTYTTIPSVDSKYHILLSSAMAETDELEQVCATGNYLIGRTGGFIQSKTYAQQLSKKNDYYVFLAGSVFEHTFKGKIADVSLQGTHPVYKYAKAFWLTEE